MYSTKGVLLTEGALPLWTQFLGSPIQLSWPRSWKLLLWQGIDKVSQKTLAIPLSEVVLEEVGGVLQPGEVDVHAASPLEEWHAFHASIDCGLRVNEARHLLWDLWVEHEVDEAELDCNLSVGDIASARQRFVWSGASYVNVVQKICADLVVVRALVFEVLEQPVVVHAEDLLDVGLLGDCVGSCNSWSAFLRTVGERGLTRDDGS